MAKLLEGRIALILDGTPQVITVPYLFIESFQSDEDYYLNYLFASIGRILRILAFYISITLPSVYVAAVTFHPEILPATLLISISQARQGVPFPTILEMVLMLIVFELLRESGARMTGIMGQTLSIVGALGRRAGRRFGKARQRAHHHHCGVRGHHRHDEPEDHGLHHRRAFHHAGVCLSSLGLYGFLFANMALLVFAVSDGFLWRAHHVEQQHADFSGFQRQLYPRAVVVNAQTPEGAQRE